jgi:hypothetical protein
VREGFEEYGVIAACVGRLALFPWPAQTDETRLVKCRGTPIASAISRAATFFASMKSMSFGVSDSGFQSRPPSNSSGRPACFAP